MTLGEQLRARVKEAKKAYEQGLTERQWKHRRMVESDGHILWKKLHSCIEKDMTNLMKMGDLLRPSLYCATKPRKERSHAKL